jgi:hypothetical protein
VVQRPWELVHHLSRAAESGHIHKLLFDLPVAWRKAPVDPVGGRAYVGHCGNDRPELAIRIAPAQTDAVGECAIPIPGAQLIEEGSATVAGGEGLRCVYRLPEAQAAQPDVIVGYYVLAGNRVLSLEFQIPVDHLSEWDARFTEIAARARLNS